MEALLHLVARTPRPEQAARAPRSQAVKQSSSSTKTYDPADANQDGKVSEQEKIDYAQAKQDKASTSSASST
ncbi:MAG: hypothetical protein Q7T44_18050, partial [Parvibaculum sp.]|nr:hypothetical protein [Parvibaculum sp.]